MPANHLPVILVTANDASQEPVFALNNAYMNTLWQAGGAPLVACPGLPAVPMIEAMLERVDGVVLSGGSDIHPRFFDEEPLEGIGKVSPIRDTFEIELARLALARGLPLLGICRGAQVLNVAFGGNLHHDLAVQHRTPPLCHRQTAARKHEWHRVKVEPGSRLADLFAHEIRDGCLWVNSIHHQAIDRVAPGWMVTATAADGIIEAIEQPGYPFALGVQSHPEELAAHRPLFHALVKAASDRKAGVVDQRFSPSQRRRLRLPVG